MWTASGRTPWTACARTWAATLWCSVPFWAWAAAGSDLGYAKKAKDEARGAFELSNNLSREDGLSVEGRYRRIINDTNRAQEIYRALWGFFSDNLDYGYALAMTQNRAGKPH